MPRLGVAAEAAEAAITCRRVPGSGGLPYGLFYDEGERARIGDEEVAFGALAVFIAVSALLNLRPTVRPG